MEALSGRCFCEGVRFALTPPSEFASHCHCQSCRRSHAAAFVTWTAVPPERFHLIAGHELLRRYHSSPEVAWEFCTVCGSSLFYHASDTPNKVYVAVASLDHIDRPIDGHVSFEEHAEWLNLEPPLPRYQGKSETPYPLVTQIGLRAVRNDDLPIFFHHQQDVEAYRMAGFSPRAWQEFLLHWRDKVLADAGVRKSTITVDGRVAGHLICWNQSGQRLVGYWICRDYWGKGLATLALAQFLRQETERPLFAQVATHNLASLRVLEKCGFHRMACDDRECLLRLAE